MDVEVLFIGLSRYPIAHAIRRFLVKWIVILCIEIRSFSCRLE
jgi:hypothetical protein